MNGQPRPKGEIFIADDDDDVRDVIALMFSASGYEVRTFADGASLLAAATTQTPACLLLDVHMPGLSGLEVLERLNANDYAAPVLVISGRGDIPMAISAIRNGALDFIEKPFDAQTVVVRVEEVMRAWQHRQDQSRKPETAAVAYPGHERLTRREREVLNEIAGGASSKEAARRLGISFRTIEVHRAHIMEKLGARNTADLVRIVLSESQRRPHAAGMRAAPLPRGPLR